VPLFSPRASRASCQKHLTTWASLNSLQIIVATLMLANGVAPKVAAERLGHSDPSLFMNLYSHVTPSMQREAADKIGAALFG
jgi:integrase